MKPLSIYGALVLPLLSLVESQTLPYNPTTLLLPSRTAWNKNIIYAFVQGSEANPQHQLLSLDASSRISVSNLSFETITSNLPFTSDDTVAFIPSISAAGEILVYAGSCSNSTGSAALWSYLPSEQIPEHAKWTQATTTTSGDVTSQELPGANFLSQALNFSPLVDSNASTSDIYVFGGMCPTAQATTSTWLSASLYSNSMLRLAPKSSSSSGVAYTLDVASSRGPPIAEAGFTITSLTPTYSNGSGIVTQQQNFVLVGGHTQRAFINMSQVAIWSLPEESWSFVTVDSPSGNPNTELTVKSTAQSVDSRSGHSAVLTDDGSSIVVMGGWVGDVGQAADPQLAVLQLGTGFGGSGDWKWSIPTKQPSGGGIFGHGAVMLPGNIMMVFGGYNISTSSSKKRAENLNSSGAMFLNVTSMNWISEYKNPTYKGAGKNSTTAAKSRSKTIGLAAGLSLGVAAVMGAVAVYFCYSRRLKRKRRYAREKELRSLSLGVANYYSSNSGEMERLGGGFPWAHNAWNQNHHDQDGVLQYSASALAGFENVHSGLQGTHDDGGIPSPPNRQIQRKPLHSRNARGLYQPAPAFEFGAGGGHGRSNSLGTAGHIHPIYEADEDADHGPTTAEGGVVGGDPSSALLSNVNRRSDPFTDPSSPTRMDSGNVIKPAPEDPALEREREIKEWVSDWAAADALLNAQARSHSTAGRISPTRRAQLIAASLEDDSGRTASNLSERSAMTLSRSNSSSQARSRSNSLRGFLNNAMNTFSSTNLTTTVGSTTVSQVFDSPGYHNGNPNQPPGSSGSGSTSYNTAKTSFGTLQAEGESLLPRPDEFAGGEDSPTRSQTDSPGSPSKTKAPRLKGGVAPIGWLGNLKRVFTGDSKTGNVSSNVASITNDEKSPVSVNTGYGPGGVDPRRTVSASATLWRRKQGKGDWQDSVESFDILGSQSRSNMSTTGGGGGLSLMSGDTDLADDEDEWDIERAVENRVVQVMFTVPKEKLRVVNHDVNEDKSEVGSIKGSLRDDCGGGGGGAEGDDDEETAIIPPPSGGCVDRKGKTKSRVLEMVETLEGRSSSPGR